MNDMTTALHLAGVKIPPLNKRIWLWLRDHPHKSTKDVALALGARHGDVSSQLGTLSQRGMVVRKTGIGANRKPVQLWQVHGSHFDLKAHPLPHQRVVPSTPSGQMDEWSECPQHTLGALVSECPDTVVQAAATPVFDPATLERYPLSQLRAMHTYLSLLFNH